VCTEERYSRIVDLRTHAHLIGKDGLFVGKTLRPVENEDRGGEALVLSGWCDYFGRLLQSTWRLGWERTSTSDGDRQFESPKKDFGRTGSLGKQRPVTSECYVQATPSESLFLESVKVGRWST